MSQEEGQQDGYIRLDEMRRQYINEYKDEWIRDMGRNWHEVLGRVYPHAFEHREPREDWTRADVAIMLSRLPDFEIDGMGF